MNTHAENIGWRIVIEADPDMKIDLLRRRDSIAAAGIEEKTRSAVLVVVADIFAEEEFAFAEFAFEHEGRFGGELVDRVGGRHKTAEHSTDAPAVPHLP